MLQQESDDEIIINHCRVDLPKELLTAASTLVVVASGPSGLYITTQLAKANEVGKVFHNSTNVRLANIYCTESILVIVFIKDVKYYHIEEWDLVRALNEIDKTANSKRYIILTSVPACSVEKFTFQGTALRVLSKEGHELRVSELENPELFEGYFGDLYEALPKAIAIILVQTNYDLTFEDVQHFKVLGDLVPIFRVPLPDMSEELKKYRKSLQRDNVYI